MKKRGTDLITQLKIAATSSEPQRTELFNVLIESLNEEDYFKPIVLKIKQRLGSASIQIKGYSNNEIEYYQIIFACDFWFVLHKDNFIESIEEKIYELYFHIKGIELDLKCKEYKSLEERELDKSHIIDTERYREYLQHLANHFTETTQQVERKKLKAPVIAAFCFLLNESKERQKEIKETIPAYCERICKEFNLPYPGNVRKNYNEFNYNRNKKKVKNLIFPLIDITISKRISAYLDNKEKMYV